MRMFITEFAMVLGYSSHANFSRAFRQVRGDTPEQFRTNRLAA